MENIMKFSQILLFLVLLIYSLQAPICLAQTCQLPGNMCAFHGDCCGGCCNNGMCTDTEADCSEDIDLCTVHYCPGGMMCQVYQPHCTGCSPYPICTENP